MSDDTCPPFTFRGKAIPRKGDQRRLRFQTDGASDVCPHSSGCYDCIACPYCGRNIQAAGYEAHYFWCRSTSRRSTRSD